MMYDVLALVSKQPGNGQSSPGLGEHLPLKILNKYLNNKISSF